MAVVKYKKDGEWVAISNYTVQPIVPVQTTGNSTTEIMSQKAVTDELNLKANKSETYTKNEVNTTFLTQSGATNTYATKEDLANVNVNVVSSGAGAVVTNVSQADGTITVSKGNVQIPVGSETAETYASVWIQ